MRKRELNIAIKHANRLLEAADRFAAIDPDGELVVLARQFLRLCEDAGLVDENGQPKLEVYPTNIDAALAGKEPK